MNGSGSKSRNLMSVFDIIIIRLNKHIVLSTRGIFSLSRLTLLLPVEDRRTLLVQILQHLKIASDVHGSGMRCWKIDRKTIFQGTFKTHSEEFLSNFVGWNFSNFQLKFLAAGKNNCKKGMEKRGRKIFKIEKLALALWKIHNIMDLAWRMMMTEIPLSCHCMTELQSKSVCSSRTRKQFPTQIDRKTCLTVECVHVKPRKKKSISCDHVEGKFHFTADCGY